MKKLCFIVVETPQRINTHSTDGLENGGWTLTIQFQSSFNHLPFSQLIGDIPAKTTWLHTHTLSSSEYIGIRIEIPSIADI